MTTPSAAAPAEVALCVVTLLRPTGLARCLRAISRLELPPGDRPLVRVVVVDNDATGSAGEVVASLREGFPWTIDYLVQAHRGIPGARNLALAAAGDVDLVGFIDDDESPRPTWLAAMIGMWRRTGADVLMGASVPRFGPQPPAWVVEGRFFERPRFPSGQTIHSQYARTSGVLIDRRSLPEPPVFDERFRYSGGSDTYLFSRMAEAGARFVWVDEAVVEETVPESRATSGWLVRRGYRLGNTRSLQLVVGGASPSRRLRRVAGALLRLAAALPPLMWSLMGDTGRRTRAAQRVARSVGELTGALGFAYAEYREVHGT